MSDLRSRLIRLAHTHPELRPHVLPLVAERTAARQPYDERRTAGLFNWLTNKVLQAVRPYNLPVKAEVVLEQYARFEGVIHIGGDPRDRNLSMHLTVQPVKTGPGVMVYYNVELLDGKGKSVERQGDYNPDAVKRQSARVILENLAIILSSNDKIEMGRTAAWENLPEGWTEESVQSFWDNLTGDVKHKITKCMKQMEGKVTDTGAFCGSLASQVGYRAASAGTLDATTMRRAAIRVAHEDASVRGVILPMVSGRVAAVGITPSARRQLAQRARAYLISSGEADAYDAETARLYVVEGAAAPEYQKGGSMAVSGSSRRYFEPKITVGVDWDGQ